MKFKRLVKLFLLVPFLFSNTALADEQSAASLLKKVVAGLNNNSYKATAVYIRPSGMEAIDIEYSKGFERITSSNDSELQVIHTNGDEIKIYSANRSKQKHKGKIRFQPLKFFQAHQSRGLKSYQLFISKGYHQVAGRQSVRLSIISNTNDRYSYIYWVDLESQIILRHDVLDENGELIERMVFTSLSLNEIKSDESTHKIDIAELKTLKYNYAKKSISQAPVIGWLPPEFSLHSIESIAKANNKGSYERIIYTDGFAFIEIFTAEVGHEARMTRGQQLDAFHVYKGVSKTHTFTVEGQMPYGVLKKVGSNFQL
ncbi:MAG: hypothetical protein COB22_06210 [Cycloclasticus sp.]|nr:MAG: hypothetical protein COB22_06210 [Cycloclasticus sp.]